MEKFTAIPNSFIELISSDDLSSTEYKIILIVARKTIGYQKNEDWISISQFEKLVNKSGRYIIKSIDRLVAKNILVKKTSVGKRSIYKLNLKPMNKSSLVNKSTPVNNSSQTYELLDIKPMNYCSPTKENNTKENNTKEIVKPYSSIEDVKEKDFEDISIKYDVPIDFVKFQYDAMVTWAGSKPNNPKLRDRNWRMTLMGFVRDKKLLINTKQYERTSKISVIKFDE